MDCCERTIDGDQDLVVEALTVNGPAVFNGTVTLGGTIDLDNITCTSITASGGVTASSVYSTGLLHGAVAKVDNLIPQEIVYADASSNLQSIPSSTAGFVLTSNGAAAPSFQAAGGFTGVLPIANGGTASTTATGSGETVLATSPSLVTPNIGVASGTSLSVSGTVSGSDVQVLNANASQAVQTNGSKNLVTIANTGTGNNVLSASPTLTGTVVATNISASGTVGGLLGQFSNAQVVGSLTLQNVNAYGTLSVNDIGVVNNVVQGSSGQVLTSNGTSAAPSYTSIPATNLSSGVTGVLGVVNGGTGVTTSTGTGSVVLNDTPVLVDPFLGDAEASSLHTTFNIGCDAKIFTTDIRVLSTTANSAVQTNSLKDLVTVANTGTGSNVMNNGPTLISPILGTASGTSLTLGTPLGVASGGTGQTSLSAVTVGNASQSVSSTNVSGGTGGSVVVQTGIGTTGFVAPGVLNSVFKSQGPGLGPVFSLPTVPTYVQFSSGTSYSSPVGCVLIQVFCTGAGGGGGGSSGGNGNHGGGGGGGETSVSYFAPGTYSMTFGVGGSGGLGVGGLNGGNGTATTFGSLTATFGLGGEGGAANPTFGGTGGGTVGGGIYKITGDSGQPPGTQNGGNGGRCYAGRGGKSGFYTGAATTAPPLNGQVGGGGGGAAGATGTLNGGSGGNGFIQILEFYQ